MKNLTDVCERLDRIIKLLEGREPISTMSRGERVVEWSRNKVKKGKKDAWNNPEHLPEPN